jgi:transposase-like protein
MLVLEFERDARVGLQVRSRAEACEGARREPLPIVGDRDIARRARKTVASKIGCSAEVLRKWAQQAERDQGCGPG